MDSAEIDIIKQGNNLEHLLNILDRFVKDKENVFDFYELLEKHNRLLLWDALFQNLQKKSTAPSHCLSLAAIRILSRDKKDLDNIICEKWITILVEKADLFKYLCIDDETMPLEPWSDTQTTIEALKCLCNLAFNSETVRALCAHTCVAEGIIARIKIYKEIPHKDEIILYDMKLLFILTALRSDIKNKVKDELHGIDYLICLLNEILVEATLDSEHAGAAGLGATANGSHCYLSDGKQTIVCEILKTMFNLVLSSEMNLSEDEEATFLKLMPTLTMILYAHASDEEKLMELRSNVANLLTSVPPKFYQHLTPQIDEFESCQYEQEGRNMDSLQALVDLLIFKLSKTTSTRNQYENLSPILTVMNKSAESCREQRKFLRSVVLPPLRDVSEPPEIGNTLRNQMCRLLTTPITSVRDLVAELLFVLCKGKVGRMVKYTGFGNAAGHLAQKGLLAGGRSGVYSSSSDDSDTDEYLAAEPHIDPVVGCTRPPRTNPMEGMTEEQKEYEAMKLVNLFDKMLTDGAVRPARVGPDGRPQPIDHVLQLRENLPNTP